MWAQFKYDLVIRGPWESDWSLNADTSTEINWKLFEGSNDQKQNI